MMMSYHPRTWLVLTFVLLLAACSGQRVLMPTPNVYVDSSDDIIVEDPEYKALRMAAAEVFRKVMVKQLALTPRKEVFIFVHGFHNDFDDAAFAMAELWHFLGRIGVPIIYTRPAGPTDCLPVRKAAWGTFVSRI